MPNPARYDQRLSVSLTDKMSERLEELASARTRKGQPVNKSDLIREALRLYLDEQPDVRGSRQHLARSLEGQLNQLAAEQHALADQVREVQAQLEKQAAFLYQLGQVIKPVLAMAQHYRRKLGEG